MTVESLARNEHTPPTSSSPPPPQQQFLYLTTKGWKTRKEHKIEIWFVKYKNKFYVLSENRERAHWVQNISHDPHVSFSVESQSFQGIARIIDSKNEPSLSASVAELMQAKYEWNEGLIVELLPCSCYTKYKNYEKVVG